MILLKLNKQLAKSLIKVLFPLTMVYLLYMLSYAIVSIMYFLQLQYKVNCGCSKNWKRYALVLPIIVMLLGLVILLILGASMGAMSSSQRKNIINSLKKRGKKN